jgi:hypothetical protein
LVKRLFGLVENDFAFTNEKHTLSQTGRAGLGIITTTHLVFPGIIA